jgi:hypothetical protein
MSPEMVGDNSHLTRFEHWSMKAFRLGLFFIHHSKFVIQQNDAGVLGIHGPGFQA